MNNLAFLSYLSWQGVYFSIDGGKLNVDAPPSVLSEADKQRIQESRWEVIFLLPQSDPAFVAVYGYANEGVRQWLDERAAIAEYDGRLIRSAAELLAVRDYQAWQSSSDSDGRELTTYSSKLDAVGKYPIPASVWAPTDDNQREPAAVSV